MSDLIFCTHCNETIYVHENICPHCYSKEPSIGTQSSKAIALSFLMGLSVACNPKTQPPETPEIPVETPAEESSEEKPEALALPAEVEEELVDSINQELILERPEESMQMKYGIPDMYEELYQPWLQISSIKLDAKYAHHEQVLKQELQKFLNSCDASVFPSGDTINIELSLRSGIVTKPLLQEQGLTKPQEKCIQDALWKKRLDIPMSGTLSLTLQHL